MNENPLIQALKELCLFLNKANIDYMLVGGLAVGIWSQPRATVDIDFLVSVKVDDFSFLMKKLRESGRFVFIHNEPTTFKKISFLRATLKQNTNISADFLFIDDEFKIEALRRKETVPFGDFTINISTPEDLILLKRLSDREQDRLDADKIFEMQKDSLDLEYIKKWSKKLNI